MRPGPIDSDYAFTAMIIPVTLKDKDPWSLVLMNKYDIRKDTARKLFEKPYVEEEGYATNGRENIAIRILRIDKVTTKSGKQTLSFRGRIVWRLRTAFRWTIGRYCRYS